MKKFLLNLFSIWCVLSTIGVFLLESYTPIWLAVIVVAGFIANLCAMWKSESETQGCTYLILLIDLFFVYAVFNELSQWMPRNRMLVLLGINIYLLFLHSFRAFKIKHSAEQ